MSLIILAETGMPAMMAATTTPTRTFRVIGNSSGGANPPAPLQTVMDDSVSADAYADFD
jgi:hypothetical protein